MLELTEKKYTNTVLYEESVSEKRDFYAIMANIAFFMVVFFNIFGTSLPFRERVYDVSEVATSNIVNQIVFTSMFFISLIALIPKVRMLNAFVTKEKYLFLFVAWCALSIIWSDYSFVSFKRWFQLLALVMAITAALFYLKTDEEFLKFFKPITALFIIFSFISVYTIPEALDEYGVWRGLSTSKNHLGQAALIGFLVWVFALKNASFLQRAFGLVVIAISLILLFGSESSTAIFAFFITLLAATLFYIDNQFKKISAGRVFSFITLTAILSFIVYAFIATPDLVNAFLGNFDEDITFTGRTWLWEDVLREASKHLWLGAGFQGFWVVTNEDLLRLYEIYPWLPKQAHNGYVDLINEVGIIGTAIFLLMIISYFKNVIKLHQTQIWAWFVVAVLIINLQESTLFHGGVLTGSVFVFAYLVVMMRKFDQDTAVKEEAEEE
jgi:exopolysaccharide production protein ExoQ